MRLSRVALASILISVCFLSTEGSQSTRDSGWVDDLKTVDSELPRLHKNLFFKMRAADFHSAMTNLETDVPRLNDAEIIIRLAQIIAAIGDAHTEVSPPRSANFHFYPLGLYTFSDGVFVISADSRHQQAIESRVVSIAGTRIEKAEAEVSSMLAYDNPSWLHARVHSRLLIPEVLKWFGILPAVGPATFVLQAPGREESQLEVEPIAPGQALNLVQPWGPKKVPEPLYLVSRNENYWFKLLPESKTIYLQYNSCRDRADLRFEEFTKQVFTFVNEHPVDRFVVDLRWNGGGGADVVLPLISALEKRPAINAKGHLFVLIGRETFSSGMDDAIYFRDRTQALFVGEPTGGKPNSYGEVQRLELPYSHTVISYSTKFSHPIRGSDPASFEPDIPVTVSSQQYFAGEDPYLAAALAYH